MESFKAHYCTSAWKKSSVYRSVRVNIVKRAIWVRYNVFCICFQLMIDSQDHQPCLQPLHPLASHCWESPTARKPRLAAGPLGKREEKAAATCYRFLQQASQRRRKGLVKGNSVQWKSCKTKFSPPTNSLMGSIRTPLSPSPGTARLSCPQVPTGTML